MAKTGLQYYSSDTDRFMDIRIKKLRKAFGCAGYAVYSYLLNEIYRVRGCVLEWDEATAFDVADYWGLKEQTVEEIVSYCCNVGLFNKELRASGNVLTSKSIQRRYAEACRRTNRVYTIDPTIDLLSEEKVGQNREKSDKIEKSLIKGEKVGQNAKKSDKSAQKKRKENKINNPPLPPLGGDGPDLSFCRDEIRTVFEKWLDYKREIGKRYKTQGSLRQAYEKLERLSNGNVEEAREIIDDAIANGYAGFFALSKPRRESFTNTERYETF